MSKVKLSKAELAALDALIASFDDDAAVQSYGGTDLAFIAAITRVTRIATKVVVKATPYVTEAIGAASAGDKVNIESITDAKGNLDVNALIKLREAAN